MVYQGQQISIEGIEFAGGAICAGVAWYFFYMHNPLAGLLFVIFSLIGSMLLKEVTIGVSLLYIIAAAGSILIFNDWGSTIWYGLLFVISLYLYWRFNPNIM